MSSFDPKAFAQAVLSGVTPHVSDVLEEARDLRARLAGLQADIEGTFGALKSETDPQRVENLKLDLEVFMPARKAAILAAAEAHLSGDVQAALDRALEVAVKIALTVAEAFLVA